MTVDIAGESLDLLPQRAAYWPAKNVLLLADMHLGKVNHFRKAGIPVPTKANDKNIEMFIALLQRTGAQRVICLGDLFHSHYNPEWEIFGQVIQHFSNVCFELVVGNHDIMSQRQYVRKNIVMHESLQIGPFLLTHHPLEENTTFYNLAGHLHPGVRLTGRGRQAVTLPCFLFGQSQGLLPAFGAFTGLAKVSPRKDDKIFVITGEKVLCVS